MTLSLLGAGAVLALFVLVPRAAAAIRRHPCCSSARLWPPCPFALIVFFGYFADGRAIYGRAGPAGRLAPLAIIALAALGGLILIADDLRTRFGLAQRGLTPWQRLTGTTDTPTPAPWRALGGIALVGLALILGLGSWRQSAAAASSLVLLLVLAARRGGLIAVPSSSRGWPARTARI